MTLLTTTTVAGPAGAFSHPKHHAKPTAKPAAVTQVTGHKLSAALLPGSDWGAGYTSLGEKDTFPAIAFAFPLERLRNCLDFAGPDRSAA